MAVYTCPFTGPLTGNPEVMPTAPFSKGCEQAKNTQQFKRRRCKRMPHRENPGNRLIHCRRFFYLCLSATRRATHGTDRAQPRGECIDDLPLYTRWGFGKRCAYEEMSTKTYQNSKLTVRIHRAPLGGVGWSSHGDASWYAAGKC